MNNKPGLADRMRDWMRKRKHPFAARQVCDGLDIPKGYERDKVRRALHDFLARGEIQPAGNGKFRYNRAWHKPKPGKKGELKARIFKAMYVSITRFSVSDIQRLSEAPNRNYIYRIIRELIGRGYIRKIGWQPAAGGIGTERVYSLMNRDQFRIEVME